MGNKVVINVNGLLDLSFDIGTTVYDIMLEAKKKLFKTFVGAKINNVLVDYSEKIYDNVRIDFIDYTDLQGNKMYQSGLKFILILAIKSLWGKDVSFKYSLDKGIYVQVDKKMTEDDIVVLKNKMNDIVSYNYPIKKHVVASENAIRYYLESKDFEKALNVQNIPNRYVEMYEIVHSYNYFYSSMPYSTDCLSIFDIKLVDKNAIVLLFPKVDSNGELPDFHFNPLIYNELLRYSKWSESLHNSYVSDMNEKVARGEAVSFIKMNNIFIDESLYNISKDIVRKRKNVKVILLGGPSSSGKTTSTHRLCNYLEAYGLKPIMISLDDYFKERVDTPKDKNGNYDFESIDAIDIKLFNKQLKSLLDGKEVLIPKFNFLTGEKEYNRDPLILHDDNILLIEGIHCLNDKVTEKIDRENKYKVLICPFTPLGLDQHNHLSTTDMRLIRRIVRDNRVRGRSVEVTLKFWSDVKYGEDNYIFPYTDDIDAVFNTAYAYELGVLRVFAEPLLFAVPRNSLYYDEARRLLGLLRMFYPISSEYLDNDNVLREFIGGSLYET